MRFYAVATGSYDDYIVRFIMAECPYEAALKFMRSKYSYMAYSEVGTIYEAKVDNDGVLHTTTELCTVELVGSRGYLWDGEHEVTRKVCRLCGDWPGEGEENFLNEERKCATCAKLKQVRAH